MFTKFHEFIAESSSTNTVVINGIRRSAVNSNGEFIAKSEQGIINFYKWFGDSKFVDENGRPLVLYHGTSHKFSIFEPSRFGKLGNGMYFTSFKSDAEYYMNRYGGNELYAVYLKSDKLAEISTPLAKKELPSEYDAVWAYRGNKGEEIVVYQPNQIKAVNNDGSFDVDDNNIYS